MLRDFARNSLMAWRSHAIGDRTRPSASRLAPDREGSFERPCRICRRDVNAEVCDLQSIRRMREAFDAEQIEKGLVLLETCPSRLVGGADDNGDAVANRSHQFRRLAANIRGGGGSVNRRLSLKPEQQGESESRRTGRHL